MILVVFLSVRLARISLDSRESIKDSPYFNQEGNGHCNSREKINGSLDFLSLPNLKENPLVGNIDGKKSLQKTWQLAPSK